MKEEGRERKITRRGERREREGREMGAGGLDGWMEGRSR